MAQGGSEAAIGQGSKIILLISSIYSLSESYWAIIASCLRNERRIIPASVSGYCQINLKII